MKKTLLLVSAVLLALSPLAAQKIIVQAPSAGQMLTQGADSFAIGWVRKNVQGKVKIQLVRPDGSLVGDIDSKTGPYFSPYKWLNVGTTTAGMAEPGDYKVRVITLNGIVWGDSGVFMLKAQGEPPPPAGLDNLTGFNKRRPRGNIDPGFQPSTISKPDLIVCKSGPGQLTQENLCEPSLACFNLYVKIFNIGNAESKECWLKIAFNGGGSASGKIPAIKPGGSFVFTDVINTHLDGSLSDQYTFWIDEKNEVNESKEGNNILSGALSINYLEPAKCSDGAAH